MSTSAASELHRYFSDTRNEINNNRRVKAKVAINGGTNPFGEQLNAEGKRISLSSHKEIEISKNLTEDFVLVVKHPMAFTALLPLLKGVFPIYATIRNPLSCILSWNSISAPVSSGRAPQAEARDKVLEEKLSSEPDLTARQVLIADWMFKRYILDLPIRSIIKYEDIISTNGANLSSIVKAKIPADISLQSMNANKLYSRELVTNLTNRLLNHCGAWSAFYSEQDIYNLNKELLNRTD